MAAGAAGKKIDEAGDAAKRSEPKLRGMASASASLGSTLTRFLGAGALLSFAKTSLTEFAKVERAINSLAIQMKNLGAGGAIELAMVRKELEAIEKAGDGALRETIPAFQTFLGLTKDVQASMSLVRLAANIAESGLTDLAGAVNTLESVISGRASRELKNLGINLKEDVQDGAIDAGEALRLLFERFPDGIRDINDTQDTLDRFFAFIMRKTRDSGEALAGWAGQLETAWIVAAEGGRQALGWFDELKKSAQDFFATMQTRIPVDVSGIRKRQEAEAAAAAEIEKTKAADAEREKQRLAEEEAIRIAAAEADRKRREEAAKLAAKVAEVERQADEKLLQVKISTAEEGSQAKLDLELEALRQQEEHAIASARMIGASTTAIHESFLLARKKKEEDYFKSQRDMATEWAAESAENWQKWLADIETAAAAAREANAENENARLEAQLAGFEEYQQEWLDLELQRLAKAEEAEIAGAKKTGADVALIRGKYDAMEAKAVAKHNKAMVVMDAQLTEAQLSGRLAVAQASINLGVAIFGETKALMVAQAIIDTWAGAARALKDFPYPYNLAVAGLVVAAGMANVAKIRATKKEGSGKGEAFDDAVNDERAYTFGRKSVEDFIKHTGRGHQQALRKVLPSLATQEGRHAAVDRAEMMERFASERKLSREIKELVTIVRKNINAGDPTGGIPRQPRDRAGSASRIVREMRRGEISGFVIEHDDAPPPATSAGTAPAADQPPVSADARLLKAGAELGQQLNVDRRATERPAESTPSKPASTTTPPAPTRGRETLSEVVKNISIENVRRFSKETSERLAARVGRETGSLAGGTGSPSAGRPAGVRGRAETGTLQTPRRGPAPRVTAPAEQAVSSPVELRRLLRDRDVLTREPSTRRAFDERAVAAVGARASRQVARSEKGLVTRFQEILTGALERGRAPRETAPTPDPGGDAGEGVTQHFHIGNVYGGDAGLRELSRKMDRAARLDRTRRMR